MISKSKARIQAANWLEFYSLANDYLKDSNEALETASMNINKAVHELEREARVSKKSKPLCDDLIRRLIKLQLNIEKCIDGINEVSYDANKAVEEIKNTPMPKELEDFLRNRNRYR